MESNPKQLRASKTRATPSKKSVRYARLADDIP